MSVPSDSAAVTLHLVTLLGASSWSSGAYCHGMASSLGSPVLMPDSVVVSLSVLLCDFLGAIYVVQFLFDLLCKQGESLFHSFSKVLFLFLLGNNQTNSGANLMLCFMRFINFLHLVRSIH